MKPPSEGTALVGPGDSRRQMGVVEGATVIRIAPEGFEAPYVLAAVRLCGLLRCGELLCEPESVPQIGAVVRLEPGSGTLRFRPIRSPRGRDIEGRHHAEA